MAHEVELVVEVGSQVGAEMLSRLTRQIQDDLRADGKVAVTGKPAVAPEGARSGSAMQIGALIISGVFSAATVKAVRDVVLRRMAQSSVTSAKIIWRTDVQQGEFSVQSQGLAPEELTALVTAWRGDGAASSDGSGAKGVDGGPQACVVNCD